MEEVIDIDNLDDFGAGGGGTPRSVNFGGGLEFLMNDKKRNSSAAKTQIDLAELDNLENELNGLSGGGAPSSETRPMSGLFGAGLDDYSEPSEKIHLGNSTFEAAGGGNTQTWDGFMKMNLDAPSSAGFDERPASNLSATEKRRKKRAMLKKINDWADKGLIKNNPNFTMDTPFDEVEDEYETCLEDKRKKDSVKLYGWWFMTFVNTVEYANKTFNPFDIDLEGWSEQISDDLDSYEDIFGELHEKYKSGKMSPELSLLLRMGCSAAMVAFTNQTLSKATPGFNDVIRQSPELMKLFTNATVETMSKQNPTMGFMNSMMNGGGAPQPPPAAGYGRPPPPVETQGPRAAPPPQRPGQINMNFTSNAGARPDLAAARPPMFREQGVNMDATERVNTQEKTPFKRAEMSGPSVEATSGGGGGGIDSILAGLKPKNVK
jgi:hypothetical protein